MEIAPDLHYLQVPLGAIWTGVTLAAGDRLAVVDTAMKGDGVTHVLPYIERCGLATAHPLIINTHMHCDHIGSNSELREVLGATVTAHAADAPGIRDLDMQVADLYAPFAPWLPGSLPAFRSWLHGVAGPPVPEVEELHEGARLDLSPWVFRVLHTPGHTHGCITLYDPEYRVALAGDTVQGAGTVETGVPMLVDTGGYRRSLERLAGLDIKLLVVCHPFLPFDTAVMRGRAIREFLAEAQAVDTRYRDLVRRVLGAGPATAAQVAAQIAPELGVGVNLYLVITTLAYLQELQAQGAARCLDGSGNRPDQVFAPGGEG